MLSAKIKTNADQVARLLRGVYRDQAPFASAKALTLTARDGVDAARASFSSKFKVRSKGLPKQIRSSKADKRAWPNLSATVHVTERVGFLALHEDGGLKRPKGSGRLAIATSLVSRTSSGKVYAGQKPARVAKRRGAFVTRGGRNQAINAPARASGGKVRRWYTLTRRARIRKTPWFERPILVRVANRWERRFLVEFRKAVKTARPRF